MCASSTTSTGGRPMREPEDRQVEILCRPALDRTPAVLAPREAEVLQLVAGGRAFPEIGELLFVSTGTVKTHLKNIYRKLAVRDRGSAVAEGLRRGLIE